MSGQLRRIVFGAVAWAWIPAVLLTGCADFTAVGDGAGADIGTPTRFDVAAIDGAGWVGLEVVATGCAEVGGAICRGIAPFTVRLTAVSSRPLDPGYWSFGDGAKGEGHDIDHTYSLPGSYTVVYTVAHGGGTASVRKEGYVVVSGAPAAASCDQPEQCTAGRCICTAKSPCVGISDGLCLSPCSSIPCAAERLCVQVPPRGDEPWRATACFEPCDGTGGCSRPGFACRWLPGGGVQRGWVRACVPSVLRGIGSACRDATGAWDDGACAAGRCLAMGARGYCTADCEQSRCPQGSRCARFGGGVSSSGSGVCLRVCRPGLCDEDPALGCEASGGVGALGFTDLNDTALPDAMYCSAKKCRSPTDCGLAGRCDLDAGGYCTP